MTQQLMQAVVVQESGKRGDWNQLAIAEVPRPVPKADEVLVQVEACSVNRADLLQRRGLYPPPPGASTILGLDFAGFIVKTGPEVSVWHTGDRVFGIVSGGGYGRYVAVPAQQLVVIPETMSFTEAAATAEVFFTAFLNLFMEAHLQPQEVLLVHGGGSGVGTAAIQLARTCGATVVTTAGNPEKVQRCLELGATHAIDYKAEDFAARVQELTGGADVILDWIGAPYLNKHLEILKPLGRLVLIGFMGGSAGEVQLTPLLTKRLKVIGSVLRSRSEAEKAALTSAFTDRVLPLLASRQVRPLIDRVFSIESAEAAHERMREGKHFGKIVLTWHDAMRQAEMAPFSFRARSTVDTGMDRS